MFIYVIVCSETLKIYVGQHKGTNLQKYLQTKFSNAKRNSGTRSHLFAAMKKHPHESWSIHPLISGVEIRQELDELEKHFIRALNAQHPDVGYNICDGGEGFTGPHTEKWRQETLTRVNEYWANPDSRMQRSQQTTERWQSGELRKAHEIWRAENPEKLAYWTDKKQSAESNQKRSEQQKISMLGNTNRLGQKQSPEEIAKRVAKLKGVPFSDERKAKLKASHQTCSCPAHVLKRQQQDFLTHK
jgi:hypothetical protein